MHRRAWIRSCVAPAWQRCLATGWRSPLHPDGATKGGRCQRSMRCTECTNGGNGHNAHQGQGLPGAERRVRLPGANMQGEGRRVRVGTVGCKGKVGESFFRSLFASQSSTAEHAEQAGGRRVNEGTGVLSACRSVRGRPCLEPESEGKSQEPKWHVLLPTLAKTKTFYRRSLVLTCLVSVFRPSRYAGPGRMRPARKVDMCFLAIFRSD